MFLCLVFTCMNVCEPCPCGAWGGQDRLLGLVELKSQIGVSFRAQGTEQVNCKSSRCVTSSLPPYSLNSQARRPVPSLLAHVQSLPSGSGDPPFSIWPSSKAQPEKATSSKQASCLSRVNRQVLLWVPTHPEPSRTAFFVSQGALAFSWDGQIVPAGSVIPD